MHCVCVFVCSCVIALFGAVFYRVLAAALGLLPNIVEN